MKNNSNRRYFQSQANNQKISEIWALSFKTEAEILHSLVLFMEFFFSTNSRQNDKQKYKIHFLQNKEEPNLSLIPDDWKGYWEKWI